MVAETCGREQLFSLWHEGSRERVNIGRGWGKMPARVHTQESASRKASAHHFPVRPSHYDCIKGALNRSNLGPGAVLSQLPSVSPPIQVDGQVKSAQSLELLSLDTRASENISPCV